jgi:guanine deaminase
MCLGAIYWARPERLVFAASKDDAAEVGFDDSFIYKEIVLDYNQRSIATEQQLATEGKQPFELWKNFESRIDY